ncbi:helix-turn-helix domain-containing protein [Draconibacterium sp. IB214405]|uniref:helix-turn-helix domain-containing protein n=1 Tax=Draconibacterium sp. IB214405 TaxID=3097352 RepID=UPI002A151402|nr:helix-turn-helix domain-containing protein [Draconibacterium sp. IB214405]MDX8338557.1 helix-turn-helix domain-containing protein [Draconibacterium sp. IB214405]
METGKLIKELRIKKGMTQEELAEKTEVSARTIQRIENGQVDPRAYTLQMIAKALEVDYNLFKSIEADEKEETEKQNNIWLGFLHLSGIIPLLFPTLLMWRARKQKTKTMSDHYRSVISFQLLIFGVLVGCLWVYWKVNITTPLLGVLLINTLLSITNAVKVMNGESYISSPFAKHENKD